MWRTEAKGFWNTSQFSDECVLCHVLNTLQVILPPSALDRLASFRIDYPMLFGAHNPQTQSTSYSGVLEFVAEEESIVYMPYRMMKNIFIEGAIFLMCERVRLFPKGTFVRLHPHTKDFLEMSNPRAVYVPMKTSILCMRNFCTARFSARDRGLVA